MMNEIVWRHFRFEIPEDWEMLQFGRRPKSGKCRFADRYDQRMEWNWRTSTSEPDLIETINRFLVQDQRGRKALLGKWIGVETEEESGGRVSRYLRYFAEAACTMEYIFAWPERRDEILMRQILESVRPDEHRRWRAFGLDLKVGEDAELLECEVRPAMAKTQFGDAAASGGEEFQRLGMVSEWLAAPVRDWLRLKVPKRLKVTEAKRVSCNEHEIEEVEASGYAEPFAKVLRRKTSFHGAAWLCPKDGRLYFHSRINTKRSGSISCCSAFTHV